MNRHYFLSYSRATGADFAPGNATLETVLTETATAPLKRTPLHALHRALGAVT